MSQPNDPPSFARRRFLVNTGALTTALAGQSHLQAEAALLPPGATPAGAARHVRLTVNGTVRSLDLDPRVTLLDALRDRLELFGTKKGCDHGQCGACTVIVDGKRINSCLALAVAHDGAQITTIEGLASGGALHPAQAAFVAHDGFQCGYCTPGQVMSCLALADEAKRGTVSAVTADLRAEPARELSDDEIRERMSGNLCRCGAYVGIVAAVREVTGGGAGRRA